MSQANNPDAAVSTERVLSATGAAADGGGWLRIFSAASATRLVTPWFARFC